MPRRLTYWLNRQLYSTLTQRTCTVYTFIHQIYANHNLVAQSGWVRAGRYRRADIRVRPYGYHKFNGASGYAHAMSVLFKQPQVA